MRIVPDAPPPAAALFRLSASPLPVAEDTSGVRGASGNCGGGGGALGDPPKHMGSTSLLIALV